MDDSTTVVSLAYLFYEKFDKEEQVEVQRKRGRSISVKYFNAFFGKGNYISPLERMHTDKWTEYEILNETAK